MELLQHPPLALTRRQRLLLLISTVAIAATRLLAVGKSVWDWDEAQFALAVRSYDVVDHQPHPPGFPVYIALAKLVALFTGNAFRSVQMVTIAGAIVLFPLLVWLGREARFPFHIAYLGSVLTVFFPNVWVFGGGAFSDVPGLALVVAACALLLRGCRDVRAYVAGAIVLGLAAAMRPQALMYGAVPALVATWCRARVSWKPVFISAVAGLAIIIVSYTGAALASSSVEGYFETAEQLREYLRQVDSFLSPDRPKLSALAADFFVTPIPGPRRAMLAMVIAAGAGVLASLVRRRTPAWIFLAIFLPFNVFGWLMLDFNSISRYSIGFAPLYGFMAAEGLDAVAMLARRYAVAVTVVLAGVLAGNIIAWTIPALEDSRRDIAPTIAATEFVRDRVPVHAIVYAHGSMGPFIRYVRLPQKLVWFNDALPVAKYGPYDVVLTEGATAVMRGEIFIRPRQRLFDIVRKRYFEVSVTPVEAIGTFGEGWHGEESWGRDVWRWMTGRGVIQFRPIDGRARLRINGEVPAEVVAKKPRFEVRLNGTTLASFIPVETRIAGNWVVDANANAPNVVELSVDKVLNPAREGFSPDNRDLAFQLTSYAWEPAGVD